MTVLAALGIALVLEGAAYALFPEGMKRFMAQVMGAPAEQLRTAGLAAVLLGLMIAWLALRAT